MLWHTGCASGGSGLQIFAQAPGETLLNVWMAREERQHGLARPLRHATTVDRRHRHRLPIAQKVQSTREVVATLAIGDDALVAPVIAQTSLSLARNFDEAFEQDMQRLALWAALAVLGEEALTTLILAHWRAANDLLYISLCDTLE